MALFGEKLRFGTKGKLYQNLSDPGSMPFGGAGVANSLGQKRDGTKGGAFGDKAQGIDWFGSPITAGTDSQGTARLAAILFGTAATMGAGAAGGGASSGGMSSLGMGAVPGGAGAVSGGGGAYGGSAAAGGGLAASSPAWMKWAKMGQGGMQGMGGQKQQFQPTWTDVTEDDEAQRLLLAKLLAERG